MLSEVRITTSRAWKLTELIEAEEDLQVSVGHALERLLLPPAMWFAMPMGHIKLTKAQAAKLARIGAKRGIPDVLVVYDARIIGIELKRHGGRLSRTRIVRTRRGGLRELVGQEDVFPLLEAAGMTIGVCDSLTAVLAFLAAAGVPLRLHAEVAA